MSESSKQRVSIRPGVAVLSVLRHLNYKPWFALAEFVDNALQSAAAHRDRLEAVNGPDYRPRVEISIESAEPGRIVIRDNAAGIAESEFPRAFRPAEVPPDSSGLSEFGMGMKSAACWFASNWSVRTSAIGEPVVRRVNFDIEKIVHDRIDELEVETTECSPDAHFTEIELVSLNHTPVGRTIGKIREHLSDIYRIFLREGRLELWLGPDRLSYDEPRVLVAPVYGSDNTPVGESVQWKISLDDFDFGEGLSARGFVALREKGSTRYAGFSLFRRNRLIEGSADEKYRPKVIFGNPNDYEYQRVFGELHLEGFDVSHTKDGFQWDENEDPFLSLLREKLTVDGPLDILAQARNYRVRPTRRDKRKAAETTVGRTQESLIKYGPAAVEAARAELAEDDAPPENLPKNDLAATRTFDLDFEDRRWRISLELADDPSIGAWLEVSDQTRPDDQGREHVQLRMSLSHPFTERFGGADADRLEPLVRIAAGLGLAEKIARDAGAKRAPAIRMKLSRILELALSRN